MIFSFVILGICLLLSMFFSGTETSFTAASSALMHEKEKKGDKRAAIVNKLKNQPDHFLGMILLGNNVVNIATTAITTSLCISFFGEKWGVFISTFIVSSVILIFCEIMPKAVAIRRPNSFSLKLAPLISILTFLLAPIILFFNTVVKNILRVLGLLKEEDLNDSGKTELRGAIDMDTDDDIKSEKTMLKSVLDLSEVSVGDVMTHRSKVITLNADLPLKDLVQKVLHCPYTRIPLWQGTKSHIIGVLHTKLLFRNLESHKKDLEHFDITQAMTPPWFVLETTSLLDQLHAYRRRHEHFSLVVDEYGVIEGVITLEDILEEIVGDIIDETDHPSESTLNATTQVDGTIIADGCASIRDLNRMFGWSLPDEEASTLAGLLLYESERIPQKNASYAFYGFQFKVLDKSGNHITRILITPPLEEKSED